MICCGVYVFYAKGGCERIESCVLICDYMIRNTVTGYPGLDICFAILGADIFFNGIASGQRVFRLIMVSIYDLLSDMGRGPTMSKCRTSNLLPVGKRIIGGLV